VISLKINIIGVKELDGGCFSAEPNVNVAKKKVGPR